MLADGKLEKVGIALAGLKAKRDNLYFSNQIIRNSTPTTLTPISFLFLNYFLFYSLS